MQIYASLFLIPRSPLVSALLSLAIKDIFSVGIWRYPSASNLGRLTARTPIAEIATGGTRITVPFLLGTWD